MFITIEQIYAQSLTKPAHNSEGETRQFMYGDESFIYYYLSIH